MAVGQPDLLHRDAVLFDRMLDLVEVAAGINHGATLAPLRPQNRAVLLKRRDRNDHSSSLGHGRFRSKRPSAGNGARGGIRAAAPDSKSAALRGEGPMDHITASRARMGR